MLPSKLAFVDIETTGMRSFYDRIIEIAILRVEENQIIRTFHSLINPEGHLPPEITLLTGITAGDLENAPTFRQIKNDILETLSGCVFVAHNVRFDYGFLKNEFKRLDLSFSSRHFCTVRLSRALYPQHSHHNLDSIIERFGFNSESRHRALSDAKILYMFYKKIMRDFPLDQVENAISKSLKKPSIPLKLQTDLQTLPERPGVYIFYGKSETSTNNSTRDTLDTLDTPDTLPLYIGKSKNLRERILAHFSADIHSPLEMKISQQVVSIETIQTAGELGALLLESQMIKKMLPLYNKKSRIKRELIAIKNKINKDGYYEAYLEPVTTIHAEAITKTLDTLDTLDTPDTLQSYLGLFKSRKQAKSFLSEIAKNYSLCEKLLGLESGVRRTNSACFAYRLERCKGACINKEKPIRYNMRFAQAFASSKIKPWPFPGTIVIEEFDINKKEYFLINNWCYISSTENYTFDMDVYNILKQFLSRPQNYKKIRVVQNNASKVTESI